MNSKSAICILHVFPANGDNVNRNLWKTMVAAFPQSKFVLRVESELRSTSELYQKNEDWIAELPSNSFCGILSPLELPSFIPSWFRLRIKQKLSRFSFEFTIRSLLLLALGPKCILVHRSPFSFSTMMILRLLGKKIIYIHWGGLPYGRMVGFRNRWRHKLCNKIFVLMHPEERYFAPVVGNKVSSLSYPSRCNVAEVSEVNYSSFSAASILVGNNTYRRDLYPEVLDKLIPSEWECITCMLNYGLEGQEDKTRAFIERYRNMFGNRFNAWRDLLPLHEYYKYMAKFAVYICPEHTQSGLFAIYVGVMQGKAVLLRGDNYRFMRDIGIEVVDLDTVSDFSREELLKYIPTKAVVSRNRDVLMQRARSGLDIWKNEVSSAFLKGKGSK